MHVHWSLNFTLSIRKHVTSFDLRVALSHSNIFAELYKFYSAFLWTFPVFIFILLFSLFFLFAELCSFFMSHLLLYSFALPTFRLRSVCVFLCRV